MIVDPLDIVILMAIGALAMLVIQAILGSLR